MRTNSSSNLRAAHGGVLGVLFTAPATANFYKEGNHTAYLNSTRRPPGVFGSTPYRDATVMDLLTRSSVRLIRGTESETPEALASQRCSALDLAAAAE